MFKGNCLLHLRLNNPLDVRQKGTSNTESKNEEAIGRINPFSGGNEVSNTFKFFDTFTTPYSNSLQFF